MNCGKKAMMLALIVPSMHAQIAGRVSSGPPTSAPPGFQIYSNAALHLTYTYPVELKPVDGGFAAAATRRMVYGSDTGSDQGTADRCVKVLMSAGSGTEGKGAWVRLGVAGVDGRCFPPQVLQKKKATQMLLLNLARQGTTLMGMVALGAPVGYQIEGHWAIFCAAQGQPLSNSDVQTAEAQMLGLAAVQTANGFLTWVIETNDAAMFNRLLGSGVDLGTGKPEELFAGGVR